MFIPVLENLTVSCLHLWSKARFGNQQSSTGFKIDSSISLIHTKTGLVSRVFPPGGKLRLSSLFQHSILQAFQSWNTTSSPNLSSWKFSETLSQTQTQRQHILQWCKFGWKAIGHASNSPFSYKAHPPSHFSNFTLIWLHIVPSSLCTWRL